MRNMGRERKWLAAQMCRAGTAVQDAITAHDVHGVCLRSVKKHHDSV